MTKKEYESVKVGDKIRIKMSPDMNRIVKIGDISDSPWFKFESNGKGGFMIGFIWYPYQKCEVVILEETKEVNPNEAIRIVFRKCVGNDNLPLVTTLSDYNRYKSVADLGIRNITQINLSEDDLLTEDEFNLLQSVK